MHDTPTLTVKRAVYDLHLWPGDQVRAGEDGRLELVRQLPAGAESILTAAVARGDVRNIEEEDE